MGKGYWTPGLSETHIQKHAIEFATKWRTWQPPYPACSHKRGRSHKRTCYDCLDRGDYKEFYAEYPAARYYRFGLSANTIAMFLHEDARYVTMAMAKAEKELRPYFCSQVQSVVWSTEFRGEDGPFGRNPITQVQNVRGEVLAMAWVQAIARGAKPFALNTERDGGGAEHVLESDAEAKAIMSVLGVEPATSRMTDATCVFCLPENRAMIAQGQAVEIDAEP
jgi:hypothetical protein